MRSPGPRESSRARAPAISLITSRLLRLPKIAVLRTRRTGSLPTVKLAPQHTMRAYVIERNLKSLDELAGCLRCARSKKSSFSEG